MSTNSLVTSSNSTSSTSSQPLTTVVYVVSIFTCSSTMARNLFDTASILHRSIKLNSHPKHPHSRYASKLIAFTIGNVEPCNLFLKLAGFQVIEHEPPITLRWIQTPDGSNLRSGIAEDGCCGEKELIKLSTYKLDEYSIAVHLDLDTLVLRPMDELFNVMYFGYDTKEGREARKELVNVVAPTYLNRRYYGVEGKEQRRYPDVDATTATAILQNITVNAFYTKDYNMINPDKHSHRVGVQGGFMVVRPSFSTYSKLLEMVYSGEHYPGRYEGSGWFHSGFGGHIYGSMTIQGLMAYYFHNNPETTVELNRCKYNQIAENARVSTRSKNPKYPRGSLLPHMRGKLNYTDADCRDGRSQCDDVDCQRAPIKETRVAHYTYCKMPSTCLDCNALETYKDLTCFKLMREWFRVRSTLYGEKDVGKGMEGIGSRDCFKEYYLGYCDGANGYRPISHKNFTALPDDYVVVP